MSYRSVNIFEVTRKFEKAFFILCKVLFKLLTRFSQNGVFKVGDKHYSKTAKPISLKL